MNRIEILNINDNNIYMVLYCYYITEAITMANIHFGTDNVVHNVAKQIFVRKVFAAPKHKHVKSNICQTVGILYFLFNCQYIKKL